MEKLQGGNRRKYLRYRPDHLHVDNLEKRAMEITGFVDPVTEGDFDPTVVGFLTDKSHSGCSLAVNLEHEEQLALAIGCHCLLKAGPLSPMMAVVRWRKIWDEGIVKIGFEFLE